MPLLRSFVRFGHVSRRPSYLNGRETRYPSPVAQPCSSRLARAVERERVRLVELGVGGVAKGKRRSFGGGLPVAAGDRPTAEGAEDPVRLDVADRRRDPRPAFIGGTIANRRWRSRRRHSSSEVVGPAQTSAP